MTQQADGANSLATGPFGLGRRLRSHAITPTRSAQYLALAMREQERLLGRILRLIGPHPDVFDLLQDVYLQILLAGEDGSLAVESVSAYAMAIARNKAFDWLRHRKVVTALCPQVEIDVEQVVCPVGATEDLVSAGQELELVLQAVDQLPARCREVFILRRFHGMSQKQIARKLSISENTIEQHMARATRRLAEYVNQLDPTYVRVHAVLQRFTRPSPKRLAGAAKARRVDDAARRKGLNGLVTKSAVFGEWASARAGGQELQTT